MFKYFHIIKFLMTHDLTFLKKCWELEFINGEFSWRKVLTRVVKKNNNINYIFWWRLANEMHLNGNTKQAKKVQKIQMQLSRKYNIEIILGAKIGYGFKIVHPFGVVINENVKIGKNFQILQNSTIGTNGSEIMIEIGSNVIIGAMTFINQDIPDNCTVYTEKTNKIIIETH